MGSFGGETAAKKKAMWLYPKVMGFNPSERWGHSACYSNGFVYVFGGCCGGLHFSDVLVLNLDTMAWNNLVTTGHGPGPRDSHSAILVEHKMIVFGGTNGSKKLAVHGPSPGVRAGHAAVSLNTKVYIIGGVGDKRYYNDVWVLNISTCSWAQLEIRGQQPQGRFSHTALVMDTDIAIYGGCGEDERPLNELLILQLGAEHPNGRYNISMCKIFGSQCNQEKRRFVQEAEQNQKTTILCPNIDIVRKEARDAESDSKLSCRFGSDTLHPKRRRTANSKICEIESEPEEHSLSLSQHSSPSHSDQDQTPINKATSSAKAAQLFPLKKQQSQVSNPKTIIRRTSQDLYILGENLIKPKPEQNHHVVRNGRHDQVQFSAAEQKPLEAGLFQNLIGADVHGKVDGAFDSGFLMSATVNGRVFRGVLFAPGPQVISRGAIFGQNHSSPAIQITHQNPEMSHFNPNIPRHSQRPSTLHAPEPVQNFRHAHASRQSPVVRTSSSLGRDPKSQSELQGVILTLGGPGSTGGS